jgi:hypothetical protein
MAKVFQGGETTLKIYTVLEYSKKMQAKYRTKHTKAMLVFINLKRVYDKSIE